MQIECRASRARLCPRGRAGPCAYSYMNAVYQYHAHNLNLSLQAGAGVTHGTRAGGHGASTHALRCRAWLAGMPGHGMAEEQAMLAADLAAADTLLAGGRIIDAHSHIWTQNTDDFPLHPSCTVSDLDPASFTAEELLEVTRTHGVGRAVLIGHDVFHGYDNSYMLDAVRRYPGRFAVCALIDDRDTTTAPADLMRSLLLEGVSGFRIDPFPKGLEMLDKSKRRVDWLGGEGMASMWACASETRQALCCLIDPSDLPEVDAMCSRFPDTPVVIDHFARIGVSGQVDEVDLDSLCALARHPNVSVKLSAFYALGQKCPPYHDLVPMIRRLHASFGARRLMWASDCPYQLTEATVKHTYADSLALIQQPDGPLSFLTPDDREWILWKAAEQTFFSVLPTEHADGS